MVGIYKLKKLQLVDLAVSYGYMKQEIEKLSVKDIRELITDYQKRNKIGFWAVGYQKGVDKIDYCVDNQPKEKGKMKQQSIKIVYDSEDSLSDESDSEEHSTDCSTCDSEDDSESESSTSE